MFNPIVVIIILVGAFLAWLLLSNCYRDIGSLFGSMIESAKREILRDEENEDEE